MKIHSRATAVVGTVALGAAATVIAGAGPALASGQYCTSTNDFQICQQVNGSGTIINWAQGVVTPRYNVGIKFEIKMTGTTGGTICDRTIPATDGTTVQSCYWNGGGQEYLKGNICTTVYIYPTSEPVYDGESCLYVS